MEKDDFGLAIMNEQQKSALVKAMASPTSILCSDATHGTNAYDIKLITLMVINSFGNGVPVAFFFSNKEDRDVLQYLFSEIKTIVGNLEPKVFMTDDAAAYWNAFEATMDCSKTKRLLCIWHVDRNWRKKVIELVKGEDNQIEVYNKLCTLRMESDETTFGTMLDNFVKHFNAEASTITFAQYFEKKYYGRKEF